MYSIYGMIEIIDVNFLTPAIVIAKIDGKDVQINVGVDLINKKVYEGNNKSSISEQIFEYLDKVNSLPEDFFVASDDVRYQAEQAQKDHDLTKNEVSNVG